MIITTTRPTTGKGFTYPYDHSICGIELETRGSSTKRSFSEGADGEAQDLISPQPTLADEGRGRFTRRIPAYSVPRFKVGSLE